MKKLFVIGALTSLVLVSCKKDYTCECTTTSTTPEFSQGGFVIQEASTTSASVSATINVKKKDSESTCSNGDATSSVQSGFSSLGAGPTTIVTKCVIK